MLSGKNNKNKAWLNCNQKGDDMACTAFKLVMNGALLPDIYFSWDAAVAARERLKENSIAASVNIVNVNSDTGLPY